MVSSPAVLDRPAGTLPLSLRAASAARLAGAAVAIVGALVLTGWVFDVPAFKSVYGPITMKTNAAVGLLLGGVALWACARHMTLLGTAAAFLAAVLGALTLSQHVVGWNLGIDELLFTEAAGAAATTSPNRMGPNASTSLVLAGSAILLLMHGAARGVAIAQGLALTGVLLEMLAIAGYVYGAVELYAVTRYTAIALHTAVALFVLNAGILAARAGAGPMAVFVDEGPAGTLLRRLVAPVILIPLALGYVVLLGREQELYDRGLSFALFAVLVVAMLGAIVWRTGRQVAAADRQRRQAETDRDQLLIRERQARDQAESANKLKDQFIAVLSHELRTPLNVMLGWTHVLETNPAPERRARAASIVARNGRLLARLVGDLLDISRASAGQFELAKVSMPFNAVVASSMDALSPVATQKGVRLTVSLDPGTGLIDGDPERIQQIVWNLVSNAVKFTAEGGEVAVSTLREGETITLVVRDSGVGFDDSFSSEIFQPFRQADSSTRRQHGGLGLGLSIARHIAELHGGSIEASSPGTGRGATFTLRLPAAVETRAAAR